MGYQMQKEIFVAIAEEKKKTDTGFIESKKIVSSLIFIIFEKSISQQLTNLCIKSSSV